MQTCVNKYVLRISSLKNKSKYRLIRAKKTIIRENPTYYINTRDFRWFRYFYQNKKI